MRGKAPTKQLRSIPIAVSGSGHTRKRINSLDAVIRVRERPPQKRFLVECSSPFKRLAQHLTLRITLGASNVGLVGESLTFSVPALCGCEDLWTYDYGDARHEYIRPPLSLIHI